MIRRKPDPRKNKFSTRVRHRMVDLDLNVTDLAVQIGRRRSTVSTAIHTNKFPRVKRAVAEALQIKL